jgi:hypothetical protein
LSIRVHSGRRRWSIENAFLPEHEENARTVLSSTTKLLWDLSADQTAEDSARAVERSTTKLLRDFSADQAAELEAGDMLYLPPRVPHEGTGTLLACVSSCLVGFKCA